jgi:hypothetical protein
VAGGYNRSYSTARACKDHYGTSNYGGLAQFPVTSIYGGTALSFQGTWKKISNMGVDLVKLFVLSHVFIQSDFLS